MECVQKNDLTPSCSDGSPRVAPLWLEYIRTASLGVYGRDPHYPNPEKTRPVRLFDLFGSLDCK